MVSRLRWVAGAVLLAAIQGEAATSERIRPEVAFQTILDLEQTARLLAILLDSGRSVIKETKASSVIRPKPKKALRLRSSSGNSLVCFSTVQDSISQS